MDDSKRLESFEKMLAHIQKDMEETTQKMEQMKKEGKNKTATYGQLMGNKLMYGNMLALYKLYDLI